MREDFVHVAPGFRPISIGIAPDAFVDGQQGVEYLAAPLVVEAPEVLAAHPEVEEEAGIARGEAAVHAVRDALEPLRTVTLEVIGQDLPDELTGDDATRPAKTRSIAPTIAG